jgi:hypothetical protein
MYSYNQIHEGFVASILPGIGNITYKYQDGENIDTVSYGSFACPTMPGGCVNYTPRLYDLNMLCWQRGKRLLKSNELATYINAAKTDPAIITRLNGKYVLSRDSANGDALAYRRVMVDASNNITFQTANQATIDTIARADKYGVCVNDYENGDFQRLDLTKKKIYAIQIFQNYHDADGTASYTDHPFKRITGSNAFRRLVKQKSHGSSYTPNAYQMSITSLANDTVIPDSDDIYCGGMMYKIAGRTVSNPIQKCMYQDEIWLGENPSNLGPVRDNFGDIKNGANFARHLFDNMKGCRPATQQELAFLRMNSATGELAGYVQKNYDGTAVTENNLEGDNSITQFIVCDEDFSPTSTATNASGWIEQRIYDVGEDYKGSDRIQCFKDGNNGGAWTCWAFRRYITVFFKPISLNPPDLCGPTYVNMCNKKILQYSGNNKVRVLVDTLARDATLNYHLSSRQLYEKYKDLLVDLPPELNGCFSSCIFYGARDYSPCNKEACDAARENAQKIYAAYEQRDIADCNYCENIDPYYPNYNIIINQSTLPNIIVGNLRGNPSQSSTRVSGYGNRTISNVSNIQLTPEQQAQVNVIQTELDAINKLIDDARDAYYTLMGQTCPVRDSSGNVMVVTGQKTSDGQDIYITVPCIGPVVTSANDPRYINAVNAYTTYINIYTTNLPRKTKLEEDLAKFYASLEGFTSQQVGQEIRLSLAKNEIYKLHIYTDISDARQAYMLDLYSNKDNITSTTPNGSFALTTVDGSGTYFTFNMHTGVLDFYNFISAVSTSFAGWSSMQSPTPIIYNKYPQTLRFNIYKRPFAGWSMTQIPVPIFKGSYDLNGYALVYTLNNTKDMLTCSFTNGAALRIGTPYYIIVTSQATNSSNNTLRSLYDGLVNVESLRAASPTFNSITLGINTNELTLGNTAVKLKNVAMPYDQTVKIYILSPDKTRIYFDEGVGITIPSTRLDVTQQNISENNVITIGNDTNYLIKLEDVSDNIRKLNANTTYILKINVRKGATYVPIFESEYNTGANSDISEFYYNRFNNSITIGTTTLNGAPLNDAELVSPKQYTFSISVVDGFKSRIKSVETFQNANSILVFQSPEPLNEPSYELTTSYINANTLNTTFTIIPPTGDSTSITIKSGTYKLDIIENTTTYSYTINSGTLNISHLSLDLQTGNLYLNGSTTLLASTPHKLKRNAYTLRFILRDSTTGIIYFNQAAGTTIYATHYDGLAPTGADTGTELFLVKPVSGGGITFSEITALVGNISGATLATLQQVREALYMGANWTEPGWVSTEGGLPARAVYPLSDEYVVQRYGLPNFANLAGDELAPLDKKKVVAYLPADGKAAGVLMYGKRPESTTTRIIVPWNTYRNIAKKADAEPNNEVYPVELSAGSTISVSDASAVCSAFGASVALETDLQVAAERGADWCKPGWTQRTYRAGDAANLMTAAHPVNESSTINVCSPDGQRKTAVIDGVAALGSGARAQAVNCYGVKPAEAAATKENYVARPFNVRTSAWSQGDAADYTTYYFRNQSVIDKETDLFKRAKLMVDEARRTGALLRRAGSNVFKGCDTNADACFPRTSGVAAPTLREVVQPVSKTGRYMAVDLADDIKDTDNAITKEEKAIRWIRACQETRGGAVQLGPGEEYPGCGDGRRCCAPESIYGLNAGLFGADPDCPVAGAMEEDCVKDTKLPTAVVPRLGLKSPRAVPSKCVAPAGGSMQSIRTIANNLKANKLAALRMGSGLK